MIVVGGLAGSLMMGAFGGMMGPGVMHGYPLAPGEDWIAPMAWWMTFVSLTTGGIVLYAAYRIRQNPAEVGSSGTLAIVGGVLSLLAMGGWLVGAALAIFGGALAIGGRRQAPSPAPPLR